MFILNYKANTLLNTILLKQNQGLCTVDVFIINYLISTLRKTKIHIYKDNKDNIVNVI